MVDFRTSSGSYQLPHRKPIPVPNSSRNDLRPLSKIVPDINLPHGQQRAAAGYAAYPPRTTSQAIAASPSSQSYDNPTTRSRRTPSQSTTSTSNTGFTPSRTPSNVSSAISRTSSTRSGASNTPGSYVALMRKQKATVWCDRAQHEDPRLVAQQKAAKIRAAREITGKAAEGRTSTSGSMGSSSLGVRSKIRHHGLPKATGYSANLVGGGVPMRLSANEVGDEGTYNREAGSVRRADHQRTGSGLSSRSHNRYSSTEQKLLDHSQGSTLSSGQEASPTHEGIPEMDETPTPGDYEANGYFARESGNNGGSGSSSERESSFGNVGQMKAPQAVRTEGKTSEELRRRGSVDERANTMGFMGGGRLFVANPDLSD